MLRFLQGTVPYYNVNVDVVEVMHDGSRMISKEVSAVIYSCLYTVCTRHVFKVRSGEPLKITHKR